MKSKSELNMDIEKFEDEIQLFLEAYLNLENTNRELSKENNILREELLKYRKEYARISQGIVDLNQFLEGKDKTMTIRKKMATIFKFAYLEVQVQDKNKEEKQP